MITQHRSLFYYNRKLDSAPAHKYYRAIEHVYNSLCQDRLRVYIQTLGGGLFYTLPVTVQLCLPSDTANNSVVNVVNPDDVDLIFGTTIGDATIVGSPVFTADTGFNGFSSSDYIESNCSGWSVITNWGAFCDFETPPGGTNGDLMGVNEPGGALGMSVISGATLLLAPYGTLLKYSTLPSGFTFVGRDAGKTSGMVSFLNGTYSAKATYGSAASPPYSPFIGTSSKAGVPQTAALSHRIRAWGFVDSVYASSSARVNAIKTIIENYLSDIA